jgi:hypothetical protein
VFGGAVVAGTVSPGAGAVVGEFATVVDGRDARKSCLRDLWLRASARFVPHSW